MRYEDIIIDKLVKKYSARKSKSMNINKKVISSFLLFPILFFCISSSVFAFGPSNESLYDGIDVSSWQGTIDYQQVKADGIEVVYIKASQGTSYVDEYYLRNYNNARENGIKTGFYHYLTARSVDEAIAEAEHFANVIGNLSPDCRLAMDFESFGDLTREEVNEISFAFLRRVQEITGKEMVVYSDTSNASNVFSGELAQSYPLWVAEYGVDEPFPNGNWEVWVGWQYTSQGEISGINGYVDRDYFTEGIFLSDTSNIPAPATPVPSPEDTFEYTVVYGDTLNALATRFDTTVERLVELNNISNPNLIYVNQVLLIPEIGTRNKQRISYTVRSGDTLNQIARTYNTTVQSLVELNNIINPNLIYVGQTLIIETGVTETYDTRHILYRVRRGNTLWGIARRYNTTVSAIATLNQIQNPNLIYAGQILRIPNY